MVKRMKRAIGVIVGALTGMMIGFFIGMDLGGNFFIDIRFIGLRGYEAVGPIGAIIGGILGVLLGFLLTRMIARNNGTRKSNGSFSSPQKRVKK
ncbi:hypothetical protein [Bacillus sp. USDA818B3_A]|uniref:hypothetical protein n=1 Tax=Bacillus sp. USDA818B3_A TaxID=2698834 RepID=UPI00136CF2FA|nr:hypothetical protein [Bacillus sp. USDA818B3_A]